jgi:hypothetical protein
MATNLTLCLHLDGGQISQLGNHDFTCMVTVDEAGYGGKSDGLFQLNSGDDDNGDDIEAFFELITSDFGIPNKKRMRLYNIGYETKGTLKFIVTVDDDTDNKKTYSLEPGSVRNRQHNSKFHGHRDQMGRYWMERIENTDGCDFSIDHIELFPTILLR